MFAALRHAKHLLAPLTANCHTFHERWAHAPAMTSAGDLGGRWEGEWVSAATRHRGPLRCVLEGAGGRRWRARFHAGYAGVFRACYAMELDVERSEDRWTFRGESDLGWIAGGVYHYEGEATANDFIARYRSQFDHGEFRLRRG